MNVKEEYEFLQALFENIPQDIPVGTPVRNVVIPRWYKNQDPLVLHVTKAYGRDKIPVLLILFNTPGDIREDGAEAIQKQVPAVSLPRFKNENGKLSIDAQDYYVLSLLPDGTVTASSAVGKKLPSFESMGEVNDRLNLTDAYLRDGDKTNDNLVLPVLNKIIADEKEKPINRTHAYFQLYMYYLFQGDLKATAATIDQLNGSRLLQNPDVEKTELADAARTELPRIQVLAAALKEKKAPAL